MWRQRLARIGVPVPSPSPARSFRCEQHICHATCPARVSHCTQLALSWCRWLCTPGRKSIHARAFTLLSACATSFSGGSHCDTQPHLLVYAMPSAKLCPCKYASRFMCLWLSASSSHTSADAARTISLLCTCVWLQDLVFVWPDDSITAFIDSAATPPAISPFFEELARKLHCSGC